MPTPSNPFVERLRYSSPHDAGLKPGMSHTQGITVRIVHTAESNKSTTTGRKPGRPRTGSFDCPHAWRPIGWLTAFTISIVSLVPEVGWMGAFCIRVYLCLQPGMLHGAMCLQTSMLESFVYKGFLDVNMFERRYQGLARPSAVTICITVLYYRRSILHTPKQARYWSATPDPSCYYVGEV